VQNPLIPQAARLKKAAAFVIRVFVIIPGFFAFRQQRRLFFTGFSARCQAKSVRFERMPEKNRFPLQKTARIRAVCLTKVDKSGYNIDLDNTLCFDL